jgi:hypothetical protein
MRGHVLGSTPSWPVREQPTPLTSGNVAGDGRVVGRDRPGTAWQGSALGCGWPTARSHRVIAIVCFIVVFISVMCVVIGFG